MDSLEMMHNCLGLLAINRPVKIVIRRKFYRGKPEKTAAYCDVITRNRKIIGYKLVVSMEKCLSSQYSLNAIIAHEMCHVAQFEHGIFDENHHHDAKFVRLCGILEDRFPEELRGKLYNPATDTD